MSDAADAHPNIIARAEDTLTDLKATASRAKTAIGEAGANVSQGACALLRPNGMLDQVVAFTRRRPVAALTAAFALGLWINRRR